MLARARSHSHRSPDVRRAALARPHRVGGCGHAWDGRRCPAVASGSVGLSRFRGIVRRARTATAARSERRRLCSSPEHAAIRVAPPIPTGQRSRDRIGSASALRPASQRSDSRIGCRTASARVGRTISAMHVLHPASDRTASRVAGPAARERVGWLRKLPALRRASRSSERDAAAGASFEGVDSLARSIMTSQRVGRPRGWSGQGAAIEWVESGSMVVRGNDRVGRLGSRVVRVQRSSGRVRHRAARRASVDVVRSRSGRSRCMIDPGRQQRYLPPSHVRTGSTPSVCASAASFDP